MANNNIRERAGPRVALTLNTDGGANQDDREGADINIIVGQYKRHGTLPAVQLQNPLFGDFSFVSEDLMEQREAMYQAEDRFNELPAAVRSAAENDYVKFLQMFDDPAHRQVLVDSGLVVVDQAEKEKTPATTPAPATPPLPATPPAITPETTPEVPS